MINRRKFIQAGLAAGLATHLPFRRFVSEAYGATSMPGLSDPAMQPKFVNYAPNALDPGFIYSPDATGTYNVQAAQKMHQTGLVDALGQPLNTPIWGYGDPADGFISWPGRTFEVNSVSAGGAAETRVRWTNNLGNSHLLPVDENLHWCYSLPGYEGSIADFGVPTIPHLHGGNTDFQFDGNPEFFFSPGAAITGPQWNNVPGGFTDTFRYNNDVPAGNLWYHDHALGITRLNVYAGLAGFYFVRDNYDTGKADNPIGLPAYPYEMAYAIQDRMFRDSGELFFSAYPGDPFYEDFIQGEGAILPSEFFPAGGPTALAEFFGDHMLVNGIAWPKEDVEPRNYRMRLLNGTDSRFMMLGFSECAAGETNPANGTPIKFAVIGSDQGLATEARNTKQLLFEPGSRYDIVVDFSKVGAGNRVIMTNTLGDAPFGGMPPAAEDFFPDHQTDRVMAFDVIKPLDQAVRDRFSFDRFHKGEKRWNYNGNRKKVTNVRKVALFEGLDEFGRLQPLLGFYDQADKQFKGVAWHMPTTENPAVGATEVWEIYNFTGDAHPVHLHLVNFEIQSRRKITFAESGELPVLQHNGAQGVHPRVVNVQKVGGKAGKVKLRAADGFVENCPKDMVTALPGQVTKIKATFDKPGRYVWHCHILSHEDHEMMRVLHVGPGA